MNEYISREAVFRVVHGIARGIATKDTEALKAKDTKTFYKIKGAKEILNSVDTDLCYIPTADVQPIKHGLWEEITYYGGWGDTHYRCSVCGEDWYLVDGTPQQNNMNFCPKCGADMREKE
jgi:hypothetical protein